MGQRPLRKITWGAALVALGAASCAGTKQSVGIQKVDDLVARVETIHLQSELAKKAAYDSILRLRPLVTPSEGDPNEIFEEYMKALEASEQSAKTMHAALGPMELAAQQVFARWESDLASFTNESMRQRSRERMLATRTRFEEVRDAAKDAVKRHATLNVGLRDLALFLSHDFNPAAVSAVEDEAYGLRDQAKVLGGDLDRCMLAARSYIKTAAPVGVVVTPSQADAPAAAGDETGAQKTTPTSRRN